MLHGAAAPVVFPGRSARSDSRRQPDINPRRLLSTSRIGPAGGCDLPGASDRPTAPRALPIGRGPCLPVGLRGIRITDSGGDGRGYAGDRLAAFVCARGGGRRGALRRRHRPPWTSFVPWSKWRRTDRSATNSAIGGSCGRPSSDGNGRPASPWPPTVRLCSSLPNAPCGPEVCCSRCSQTGPLTGYARRPRNREFAMRGEI